MSAFYPIRQTPTEAIFNKNDVLVVFGELFSRGYANGIVEEAKRLGLKIVYTTVGRRTSDMKLRPLDSLELSEKEGPLINIPLEAGFDLEPDSNGLTPVDQLKSYGLTGWENAELNWTHIEESRKRGSVRFKENTKLFVKALKDHLPQNGNLIFVHTMAGGFPRAKVVMPIANKVFKGTGDRFLSSELFWNTEIGKLCDQNFNDVTAETFKILIDETKHLQSELSENKSIYYVAYGYHGCEVLIGEKYEWYSYSPYLQGWAKLRLEEIAANAQKEGVTATVYNVPEILTNSSSIFLGVEVSLYSLIASLKKEASKANLTKEILKRVQEKINDNASIEQIEKITQNYLTDPDVKTWPSLKNWPQHNGKIQMQKMRDTSSALIELHKSSKDLLTALLSELIFTACGKIMLRSLHKPPAPVCWIGHEIISQLVAKENFSL